MDPSNPVQSIWIQSWPFKAIIPKFLIPSNYDTLQYEGMRNYYFHDLEREICFKHRGKLIPIVSMLPLNIYLIHVSLCQLPRVSPSRSWRLAPRMIASSSPSRTPTSNATASRDRQGTAATGRGMADVQWKMERFYLEKIGSTGTL